MPVDNSCPRFLERERVIGEINELNDELKIFLNDHFSNPDYSSMGILKLLLHKQNIQKYLEEAKAKVVQQISILGGELEVLFNTHPLAVDPKINSDELVARRKAMQAVLKRERANLIQEITGLEGQIRMLGVTNFSSSISALQTMTIPQLTAHRDRMQRILGEAIQRNNNRPVVAPPANTDTKNNKCTGGYRSLISNYLRKLHNSLRVIISPVALAEATD
jgi:hypothetical protein